MAKIKTAGNAVESNSRFFKSGGFIVSKGWQIYVGIPKGAKDAEQIIHAALRMHLYGAMLRIENGFSGLCVRAIPPVKDKGVKGDPREMEESVIFIVKNVLEKAKGKEVSKIEVVAEIRVS